MEQVLILLLDFSLLSSVCKKRAPRALRAIKKFAQVQMGTADVRIETELNKHIWARGIEGVPGRVRVRCSRLRNEVEDAAEPLYTVVSYVPVESFKGLETQTVESQ